MLEGGLVFKELRAAWSVNVGTPENFAVLESGWMSYYITLTS